MFGKDKVKGHNRITRGKSGFKVTRIGDFLRKKDDNRKRNLAIGVGAITVLGVGASLLLKKKGLGITQLKNRLKGASANTAKYPKGTKIRSKDMVVKKNFDQIPNPWETPIQYKVSKDLLRPSKRGNLTRKEMLVVPDKNKVTKSVTNMSKTQKNYDSLPLDMKATVQIEKLLRRPTKTSNLGRPPESTGLKTILDDSDKTSLDKVISKAKRKVGDRLKRESDITEQKSKELKKNLKTT